MTDSFEQIAAHNEELARDIVERATVRGVTVSTAESLTAGMIASTIADIPGASVVLRGGAVTYCDEIKHRVLGVDQETLDRYTAVSHQTAREMAAGSLELYQSDIAVSATGYAGPGGGEVDMLIGEGRVAAYINCYTANSGYTNVSRRFRAAIEQGKLTYEDYSQDVLMLMLHASSLGLPFLPVRLMQGSGLMKFWGISEEKRKTMPKIENLKCVEIENPMVPGQKVVAVPVPKIDTAIIHVQQASPDGTCIIMGDEFHDIDIAIAARKTIVTCEEIVSDEFIRRDPTKTRIFGECVQAVVKAPYGAWPAQCYDYYDDDDAGLKEYDKASKYQDAEDAVKQLEKAAAKAAKALEKAPEDEKLKLAAENAQKAFELAKSGEKIPETFKDFLEKWVYSCEDQSALLDKLGGSRLMRLKNEPHLGYSTTH